jgi:hypothetical protein
MNTRCGRIWCLRCRRYSAAIQRPPPGDRGARRAHTVLARWRFVSRGSVGRPGCATARGAPPGSPVGYRWKSPRRAPAGAYSRHRASSRRRAAGALSFRAPGRGAARALSEGAEGVWVGTRLVASQEAYAAQEYKRRLVESTDGDTVIQRIFGPEWPGQPQRVLRNRVVAEWAGREGQIPSPPPPPATIGTTLLFDQQYVMPRFSARCRAHPRRPLN